METNTIVWVCLTALYLILFALNLKAFFFMRTIYKIHRKTLIPYGTLNYMVPTSYHTINFISKLRWAALIALFFFNWIAGLVCLAIEFIVPNVLPEEDDYKNMEVMRKELKWKNDKSLNFLDDMLKDMMETM